MGVTNTSVFAFHHFRLDPARRLLSRDGQPVALTPKEFDTLLVLVEAGGRVVDKEGLLASVWPDSYVGDGSLARNISVLRKALGEGAIETHRGRGYRITLPVVATDSVAASAVPQTWAASDVSALAPERIGQKEWWKRRAGLAFATLCVLLCAFVVLRYITVKSAKARTPVRAIQINSILIQKEGALDPLDEGFKLVRPDRHYLHTLYNRETNGWDRWRLVTDDQNFYSRPLSGEEKDFALRRDWILACTCALERGGGFADVDFSGKGPRFDIEFLQEGDRYFVGLTKQISPSFEFAEKIEFAGIADVAHPHTYELRYDHVSKSASLWIDGKQVASGYQGHQQFQENLGVMFGAAIHGYTSTSSMVFRSVMFAAK
jgi:DNA-binding winged helix-turn-helix (wHTH) protein